MRLEQLATDLGDQLCVTAMAAVVGFWCLRQIGRLAAMAFVMTYLTALGVVTGLKLLADIFFLPPALSEPMELSSGAPSGHVALSWVVYGSAAYLCGRASRRWDAILGQLACLAVMIGIAVTRVTLHTHTIADVISGAIVGGIVVSVPILLVWSRQPDRRNAASVPWLLAGMAAAGAFMLASGVRLSSGDFNLA